MGKLTESIKGLKDSVKQQEIQLSKCIVVDRNKDYHQVKSKHHKDNYNEDNINDSVKLHFPADLEHLLHGVASDTSQISHWSWSLGSISSSIDDLKVVLKNQDQQVITLIRENEELKNELKKKNKEIKKQKFLLRAEREAFDQYKKDTLNVLKKQDNVDEEEEISPDNTSKQLVKVKSELTHYSQMYIEQRHTMNRLSKIITTLKDDNSKLKDRLLQQEKQYNKFILEMAQRFKNSRKEFQMVISKFHTSPIPSTNLAVFKIADRNARLAYDNCMLKLELNDLKEKFFCIKAGKNKLEHLTTRSDCCLDKQGNKEIDKNEQANDLKKVCPLKASTSELSGLSVNTNLNFKCTVKTSVTSLLERNSEKFAGLQVPKNLQICLPSSESFEVMRTESAPQLRNNKPK